MAEQKVSRRANGQFKPGHKPSTAWEKGQSGNPNGRHGSMADLFKELAEVEDGKGKTRKEKILDKILKMAENGSLKAAEIYMNRVEGKAREYVEQKIIKDEIIIE
jgi:hypothetical protein